MEPTEDPAAERCDCAACRAGLRGELSVRIRDLRRAVAILGAVELVDPIDTDDWQQAHALVIDAAEKLAGTTTLIRAVQ